MSTGQIRENMRGGLCKQANQEASISERATVIRGDRKGERMRAMVMRSDYEGEQYERQALVCT